MTNIKPSRIRSKIGPIHNDLSFRNYLKERDRIRRKYFLNPNFQTIYKSKGLRTLPEIELQKCTNFHFIYYLLYPKTPAYTAPPLNKKAIKNLTQELKQHPQKYQHINWGNFYAYLEEYLQIIRHPFLYNETYTIYSYFKPIRENLIQNYNPNQLVWY